MVNKEKRIERFCNIKAEAEFREVIQVLKILGYEIVRMNGSHFIFEKIGDSKARRLTIPVHCNKVKKKYVWNIIKIIKQTKNEKL